MASSPIIGVLANIKFADTLGTDHMYVNDEYVLALEKVQTIPIIIPPVTRYEMLDTYIDICDGFVLSGGVDINPIYFNQEPSKNLGTVNNKLDVFQIALTKKILRSRKPILAICRGIQLLNICLGGTIHQDMGDIPNETILHMQKSERHRGIHKVDFTPGSKLYELFGDGIFVNSYHHQAVAVPGANLQVVGRSSDNVIEALELKGHPYAIAVQWHPEMMFARTDEMRELFESFAQACLSKKE
ncbi:gamma-glutamyl-gamma-aminobutyrate hydrolase family protein [Anaerosporobacter sp.]|uniref:gamma-glutamyl-gamma-aminobutyrate hydrolase family protein n=1 Tax=Anaerosporobacter sp. TaxID=1872529 RepID=UPI00286FA537|nr:gamma-glutamyl-gamma-aminobutyrate hydrolase family protein [Anaerosporobacter sp.]